MTAKYKLKEDTGKGAIIKIKDWLPILIKEK